MKRYLCILQEFLGLVWRRDTNGVTRINVRKAWSVARTYHTDRPPRKKMPYAM